MYHGYVCMLDCWLVCFIRFRLPSKWWSAKVQITKGAPPYMHAIYVLCVIKVLERLFE